MKRKIITIENGSVRIPQSVDVWMTQHEITDLFGCFVAKVNSNIRSILKSGVWCEAVYCVKRTFTECTVTTTTILLNNIILK